MPLPSPAPRKHIHTRRIELNGYQRADGLWDIEAHLVDTKGYEFHNRFRGPIPIGEHLHEMWMRLTLDDEMKIHAVEACTDYSPFPICPEAAANFQRLVGMQIGSGWIDRVKERIGAVEGCTHLLELLRPMATVAFQTIMPLRRKEEPELRRPALINSCHGWREDGEPVRQIYPQWHRPKSG